MLALFDSVAAELMLFAGVGLLIGGLDDLAVDLLYLLLRPWHRRADPPAETPPARRFAIFVAAWDESKVIGAMLRSALARLEGDYRLYLGVYPNDPATRAAAEAVAREDPRLRLVVNPRPGPTTKADNLNAMWRALAADRADGWQADALVLHDAEDVVHRDELRVFAGLLDRHAVVQLPVLPLVAPGSRLVSGHYADEFAESHAKGLVVRRWVRAGVPLAGTGCAIALPLLDRIAAARAGEPFDPTSLTEDYELGLALAEIGARAVLARVPARDGRSVVAVRAYFPATVEAAVRQKARWMTGIALQGWDRTGWARSWNPLDHWMRLRDRRAPLAVIVTAAAYLALLSWGAAAVLHAWTGTPPAPVSGIVQGLLAVNAVLLGWRYLMRMAFTARAYGWREALWAVPRMVVGNVIMLLAVRRAMTRYLSALGGAAPKWDKTSHAFPDMAEGGAA